MPESSEETPQTNPNNAGDPPVSQPIPDSEPPFSIRSIMWTVYVPTLLLSLGEGLVLAQVPLFAKHLGAGLGLIGVAVAAREIGTMLFDVPSGAFVSRFGSKKTMVFGTAAIGVTALGAGLAATIWIYIALRFCQGMARAVWSISRQAYIAKVIPNQNRGRALALFGGVNRMALFAGPLAAAFIAQEFGLQSTFFAQAGIGIITAVLMLKMLVDTGGGGLDVEGESIVSRLGEVVTENKRIFATAGVAAVCLQLIRNGRSILIPLWGDAIGIDIRGINLIMSASSLVDSFFFYPVGIVMDRWGRKWVLVPSLIVLGSSLVLIPLAGSFGTLLAIGLWAGVGNGISSGIVFTLGVDFSPPNRTGEFIGVWRLIGDIGGSTGPFIVGFVAQAATLGVASVVTGGFGFIGAAVAFFFVQETLKKSGKTKKR
ncbi:MAG: MFS transporter [Chloroflexi bacterium]|nr:MFS transporter [Chloroflexota bacterium]